MRPPRTEENPAVKPISPFLKRTAKAVLPKRVLVAIASKRWWDSSQRFIVERGLLIAPG
jgi:hypothetical protein